MADILTFRSKNTIGVRPGVQGPEAPLLVFPLLTQAKSGDPPLKAVEDPEWELRRLQEDCTREIRFRWTNLGLYLFTLMGDAVKGGHLPTERETAHVVRYLGNGILQGLDWLDQLHFSDLTEEELKEAADRTDWSQAPELTGETKAAWDRWSNFQEWLRRPVLHTLRPPHLSLEEYAQTEEWKVCEFITLLVFLAIEEKIVKRQGEVRKQNRGK